VLWLTECPYEDTRHVPMAWYADTVIVNDPTNLGTFRQLNPRTYYVPHAYNPKIHHPNGRTDSNDFVFVGTGFPSRVQFFEQVDWPCEPVFAGNWRALKPDSPMHAWLSDDPTFCLDNTETANLYRTAKTSANMYRQETMTDSTADGWAMGPREVELAACGTWFARNPRGEGDELFPTLPTFTEPGELADQIRWALAHPVERQTAADQARAAIADRTFDRHIADVLNLIPQK
jgi:spore maturation protein CgeB